MAPYENADYSESSSEASINNISGLDFTNMANNEIIRKTSDTTAEGSGVTITDAETISFPQNIITKTISFFKKASPLNIQLGANFFRYTFAGYNQRIVPYKQVLTTGTGGLYLHHFPALDNSNVRVGVNIELPTQEFQVGTTLYVDDTTKRVGINITNPEEELEVDGSIQIDSANVSRLKFQKSGSSPHALGELDGELDGDNGGDLQFLTKVNNGSVTEKLRINNVGAIGIGGAHYGTDGQVLTSKGEFAIPEWTNVVSSSNPTFTGTVTAGSLCTTGEYKITNNRFTVNTAGYLNINKANGLGAGEWDSANGNIVVATLYYTGQFNYSDDRIKSNTRDISNATDTLMKLKPVKYEKHPNLIVPEGVEDTDLTGVEHYTETGFVAQEVEKISELAYTVEEIKYNKDKLKGIKITDLIPFLVKAIQELSQKVTTLEATIQKQ